MVGRVIAHYRIEAELGPGGMGVVYRARDERLQRKIALKVLPPDSLADPAAKARLLREARLASQLNHPHICTVHDADEADGQLYVAMELVHGRSLCELIKEGGLPAETVIRFGTQIADALAHAHRNGVIHRDLKSANVVITAEGRAKVLDFGLALCEQKDLDEATRSRLSVEEDRRVAGTLPYLAPEVLRGAGADARSDIWALGVVLYEMAAGRLPFRGNSGFETSSAILREAPSFVPLTRLPASLRSIIQRCLAKETSERYQHAGEIRAALEAVAMDSGELSKANRAVAAPASRRATVRRRGLIVVATALLVFAILAGLSSKQWKRWFRAEIEPARSLAILPMKSLGAEAGDNYLGMGFSDTIITKVSQISDLTVRPSSAVRKYAAMEMNALEAARELQVDSVLDGTIQRSGDRIRININLLRVRDGTSLWSESLDEKFTDIFAVQDQIAQQVAEGLRGRLTAAEQARLAKRHTSNAQAYEYFLRGEESFDKRRLTGRDVIETAIQMYQRAIKLDPNYALAHARLAYAYTWMALFADPDEPSWRIRAEDALRQAEKLDSSLAETHIVRWELLWSFYGGFNIEAAIRELRRAQELSPHSAHHSLGIMYAHIGLEEASARELGRALETDPNSQAALSWYVEAFDLVGRPEEAVAAFAKLGDVEGISAFMRKSFMWKQQFEKAEELIRQDLARNRDDPFAKSNLALLTALRGNFAKAEAEMPALIRVSRRSRAFHHMAYNMASIYALQGKAEAAVQWLRATVEAGMPNYTLFLRDPHLDPIRQHPAFVAFMNELKPRWDAYRREFDQ